MSSQEIFGTGEKSLDAYTPKAYIPVVNMDPATFDAELADRGLDTQVKAAAALGLTQQTISMYKLGKRPIPKIVTVALRAIPRSAQVTRQTPRGRNGKSNIRNK